MHPPKKLCWIVLVAMCPQFTGCVGVRRYGRDLNETQAARLDGKDCRVLTASGEELVVEKASISDGHLFGHLRARDQIEAFDLERKWGSMDITIPLEEVREIEFREVHKGRTGLLVVGFTALGLVVLAGMAAEAAIKGTLEQLGKRY